MESFESSRIDIRRWGCFGPGPETILGPVQRVAHIVRQLADELRKTSCEADASTRHVSCLLVEDDNNDATMSLEAIGSVGGVEATLARSGDDAMKMLHDAETGLIRPYDIVFVDLKLQGSDAQGQHVIEQIRQHFPKTHIVIISGYLGQSVLDTLKGGYVGIVQKPLERDNLTEILDKHRLRRQED